MLSRYVKLALAVCYWTSLFHFKLNKKFSYRRDSVRRRSLRRSRSFKVTDVSTDRKPVCENGIMHTVSHRFRATAIGFNKRCMPLINAPSVTSANIAVSHMLLKTRFFGLHVCSSCSSYLFLSLTHLLVKP